MTPDQRKQQTMAVITEALKLLGCELVVQWQTEQLGAVLQARPQIVIMAKADWQPPNDTAAEKSTTNADNANPE